MVTKTVMARGEVASWLSYFSAISDNSWLRIVDGWLMFLELGFLLNHMHPCGVLFSKSSLRATDGSLCFSGIEV